MLKEKRRQAKMTQPQLAETSGVPLRTIQNWEMRGIERAMVGKLKRVCDALGCKIDDLL